MVILGIETSCDETSASLVDANLINKKIKILSNVVASSLSLHAKTGGIIPEIAAREQVKYIIPVIEKALKESNFYPPIIDAIAVTVGPGLIGSLLVGVETARTLSYIWKKPLIPVNHLIGHIYANFLKTINYEPLTINFPAIALIVSGGHTDLVLIKSYKIIKWLGGTLDDAAGEAFDKIGRLLNLPYPGGPSVEKASERGIAGRFTFPRPMIGSKDFNFSFSGLKTAIFREVKKVPKLNNQIISDIAASAQEAIIDVLVKKTLKATEKYQAKSILLGGGVSANEILRRTLKVRSYKLGVKFFAPAKNLCTDNGAMIASAAFFNYKPIPWRKITANPELYL